VSDALVRDPVYCQLVARLRERIRSGAHPAGSRFLTEREIAARFDVSRPTANKALAALVAEGALAFRKGIGTFVSADALEYDLSHLVSFTEKARAAGRIPTTRVLSFARIPAAAVDPDPRAALGLGAHEEAFRIVRLRLADGVPVILERRHLRAQPCPGLRRSDLAGSLYRLLTDRYRLEIGGADEEIRAVRLGRADARLLGVGRGDAALQVTAVARLSSGQPIWHESTLYRGDAYAFRNRLGPVRAGRPAAGLLGGTALPPRR